MNGTEIFDKVLRSYEAYYDVKRETAEAPFQAEAIFRSHDEQYFLVKSARLGEAESNEFVFFSNVDHLDAAQLQMLDEKAWETGLGRIRPHAEHRNSDVALIIVTERADADVFALASKLKHYKSYRFGLQGWSHYRLVVLEASSGRVTYNHQGRSLKKLFSNIVK